MPTLIKNYENQNMNESDFEILTENGNTGFYQGCEITQFFVQEKESKTVTNFFILTSN